MYSTWIPRLQCHPHTCWGHSSAHRGAPRVLAYHDRSGGCTVLTRVVSRARSEGERLQFMRALRDIWSIQGRSVMSAFDLSPFPRICDLGGECLCGRWGCLSRALWGGPYPCFHSAP